MQEIAEPPLLPEAPLRRKLDLGPVADLVSFLDAFKNKSEDRQLSFAEDAMAVYLLRSLIPEDSLAIERCVESFIDPVNKRKRTLGRWYLYARHLAKHFARGD